MPITPNDALCEKPRGDLAAAAAYAQANGALRPDDVQTYLTEVFRLAPLAKLDPAIVAAQSAEETGNWTSDWWNNRLNPAGIGITGDPADDEASHTWTNGTDAARAQIVHLYVYAVGEIPDGHVLAPYRDLDPRYQAALAAGYSGLAKTIVGLSGHWAADTNYADNIAQRGNAIFPNLGPSAGSRHTSSGGSSTMGHVPKPPMMDDTSAGQNKQIGSGRDPDQPRAGFIVGSCHHTSDGFFGGNQSVFDDPTFSGLTDFQVGGPWDGDKDGVIMQFIADDAPIIPWANGGVGTACPPLGDGPAFLPAFGVNGVNRQLRSIETTDGQQPDRDKGGRQIESLCFLTAWIHAEQAGQTADTFKWNMQHREFGADHQQCPGAWIINNVNQIQARTKAIMRAYQEGTPLDPPLSVTYPPGWTGDKVPLPEEGQGPVFNHGDRIKVAADDARLREHGNLQAAVLDTLKAGTVMVVTGGPVTHDERAWYRVEVVGGKGKGWISGRLCRPAS